MAQIRCGDADAAIRDAHLDFRAVAVLRRARRARRATLVRRVLEGVRNQILETLRQPERITHYRRQIGLDIALDVDARGLISSADAASVVSMIPTLQSAAAHNDGTIANRREQQHLFDESPTAVSPGCRSRSRTARLLTFVHDAERDLSAADAMMAIGVRRSWETAVTKFIWSLASRCARWLMIIHTVMLITSSNSRPKLIIRSRRWFLRRRPRARPRGDAGRRAASRPRRRVAEQRKPGHADRHWRRRARDGLWNTYSGEPMVSSTGTSEQIHPAIGVAGSWTANAGSDE